MRSYKQIQKELYLEYSELMIKLNNLKWFISTSADFLGFDEKIKESMKKQRDAMEEYKFQLMDRASMLRDAEINNMVPR